MAEVLYLRNARPNRVILKFNDIKYLLERRGTREDTTALPLDAETDPTVVRFIRQGYVEKISKQAYMELGTRFGEEETYRRQPDELKVKALAAKDVAIPMGIPSSPTPTVIATDDLVASAKIRSPRLDLEKFVSTNVELGYEKPEVAPEDVDPEKAQLQSEVDQLKAQLAALTELVTQRADIADEKPAPKPRKPRTSATKSTRAKKS